MLFTHLDPRRHLSLYTCETPHSAIVNVYTFILRYIISNYIAESRIFIYLYLEVA